MRWTQLAAAVCLLPLLGMVNVAAEELRIVDHLPTPDSLFLTQIRESLNTVPDELKQIVARSGWHIEAVRLVVTGAPELRGQYPSGWPTGSAWENADAVHLPDQKRILVATHRFNTRGELVPTHRVAEVVRHELGHAIDRALGDGESGFSDEAKFQRDHREDCLVMKNSSRKAMSYYARRQSRASRQEAFAELFAIRYGGGTEDVSADELAEQFPRCSRRIDALLSQKSPSSQKSLNSEGH
jgi:hypothetical protein